MTETAPPQDDRLSLVIPVRNEGGNIGALLDEVFATLPAPLLAVLDAGLSISALTGNAFEMNLGDAVRAWGFGPARIDPDAIRAASSAPPVPAAQALQIDA